MWLLLERVDNLTLFLFSETFSLSPLSVVLVACFCKCPFWLKKLHSGILRLFIIIGCWILVVWPPSSSAVHLIIHFLNWCCFFPSTLKFHLSLVKLYYMCTFFTDAYSHKTITKRKRENISVTPLSSFVPHPDLSSPISHKPQLSGSQWSAFCHNRLYMCWWISHKLFYLWFLLFPIKYLMFIHVLAQLS